jgi:hypothetical protein
MEKIACFFLSYSFYKKGTLMWLRSNFNYWESLAFVELIDVESRPSSKYQGNVNVDVC